MISFFMSRLWFRIFLGNLAFAGAIFLVLIAAALHFV